MSAFGATLSSATLELPAEVGAAVLISNSCEATAEAFAPAVAGGGVVAVTTSVDNATASIAPATEAYISTPNSLNSTLEFSLLEDRDSSGSAVTIALSDAIDTISDAVAPAIVAGGGSVIISNSAENTGGSLGPSEQAGAHVSISSAIDTVSEAIAPIVATSAHVTVDAAIETEAASLIPAVVTGGGSVILAAPVDTIAASNAPSEQSGANVIISSTVDNTTAVSAPAVAGGGAVALGSAVNTASEAIVPAHIQGGTGVFPVIGFTFQRTCDIGDGATLEFCVLEGGQSTQSVAVTTSALTTNSPPAVATGKLVAPTSAVDNITNQNAPAIAGGGAVAFSAPIDTISEARAPSNIQGGGSIFPNIGDVAPAISDNPIPAVATGKNVILLTVADNEATSNAPDIETERRRRMVQAIAA